MGRSPTKGNGEEYEREVCVALAILIRVPFIKIVYITIRVQTFMVKGWAKRRGRAMAAGQRQAENENDMQLVCELLITFFPIFYLSLPPRCEAVSWEHEKPSTCMSWHDFYSASINRPKRRGSEQVAPGIVMLTRNNIELVNCRETHFPFNNDHLHDLFTFYAV